MSEAKKQILVEWEGKVGKQHLKVKLFTKVFTLLERKKAEKQADNNLLSI